MTFQAAAEPSAGRGYKLIGKSASPSNSTWSAVAFSSGGRPHAEDSWASRTPLHGWKESIQLAYPSCLFRSQSGSWPRQIVGAVSKEDSVELLRGFTADPLMMPCHGMATSSGEFVGL